MRPDLKSLQIMILAAPVAVVSSCALYKAVFTPSFRKRGSLISVSLLDILYRRIFLGEEQRRADPRLAHQKIGATFTTVKEPTPRNGERSES